MQMSLGLELFAVALGVSGREFLAGGFLLGGLLLALSSTFGSRLRRGKLQIGPSTGLEFELEEARLVTTAIAATPEPVSEVGPHQEDDATRWLLADVLFKELFLTQRWDGLDDCRFQLYLYDPELAMLLPLLEPGHPGPPVGLAPNQGTVGVAWTSGEYVVAVGSAVADDTFRLTAEQKARYADLAVATSVPVSNAAGRTIGVVSGSSRSQTSSLATANGLEVQIFLAEAAARVLVDLLKWFSDGYDHTGGRESPWSAR